MRLSASIVVLFATGVAGCGGMSNVIQAGQSTYMISAGGGIYEQNPSGMREKVYGEANTYCSKMGRTMEPINHEDRPYGLGRNTASMSLTFTCK